MIPMADEHRLRRVPWVTILLIGLCVVVYFAVQPTGTPSFEWSGLAERTDEEDLRFVVDNAAIPCELVQGRPLTEREYNETFFVPRDPSACSDVGGRAHSPGKVVLLGAVVSMFLHGSVAHLFGNMLFLWVFGNNIEDRRGRFRYLLLFLAGGVVATASHVLVDPDSTVPIIGASGAIAAVMGAYFVLWPQVRVKTIIFFGPLMLRKVQALWLLLFWFATQFLLVGGNSAVAWAAHVGGFVFGVLIGLWWRWRSPEHEAPPSQIAAPSPAPALTGG
jgi:membrane associated rhomboid family serine protease